MKCGHFVEAKVRLFFCPRMVVEVVILNLFWKMPEKFE